MQGEYGDAKGKRVFYASINKGRITGAEGTNALDHHPRSKKRRKR